MGLHLCDIHRIIPVYPLYQFEKDKSKKIYRYQTIKQKEKSKLKSKRQDYNMK